MTVAEWEEGETTGRMPQFVSRSTQSKCHLEADDVVVTLPKATRDIAEQFTCSSAHRADEEQAHAMIYIPYFFQHTYMLLLGKV